MRAMTVLFLLIASVSTASEAVLLEFTQNGCHACVKMQPVVQQLQQEGIAVRHINASRERHLAQRYRVVAYPTYVVLSGGRELARYQGVQPIDVLRGALTKRNAVRTTGAHSGLQSSQTRLVPVSSTQDLELSPAQNLTEAMPSISLAAAVERARAATVRIRVQEPGAVGIATGTVIDTHGNEALILTCGHVFRDTKGQTPIEVEVFAHGQIHKFEGQLVDYEADTKDVGLVSIRPGFAIQPVPVLSNPNSLTSGTTAFSFGCDRGADPSRRDTRITAINKYNQHIGASNLEIAGAPTIGRSGGGLFDQDGQLIGVCNAADFEDDIGIYAGPGSIQWQLDRVDLAHLYQTRPSATPAVPAPTQLAMNTRPTPQINLPPIGAPSDQELIIILRDKSRPDAAPQVKTFSDPPAEVIRLLGHR